MTSECSASEPDRPGRDTGPIFVVGSMRSGSTLLRLILDSHPRIAIGAETGFMGAVVGTKQIPGWKYGAEWYQRIGWSEPEIDERLREFYSGMFERYAAAQGKARWGDKTPFHTAHIATMASIFPSSVFIGIVRHPGAVATSLRSSFHYRFDEALRYWATTNLDMVEAACSLGDRFALCRYEDLVTDAEPVLRELMCTVGETFSPRLLEHQVVQREQGAPRVVDGSTSTRDPVDPRRAHRWTGELTTADRTALEATASLAAFFGYQPLDSADRASLEPRGGRELTSSGDDLALRRQRWSSRVDFAERPSALAIDADPEELARRLSRVEAALARTRSRRAVRLADAVRGLQRRRTWTEAKALWAILRE